MWSTRLMSLSPSCAVSVTVFVSSSKLGQIDAQLAFALAAEGEVPEAESVQSNGHVVRHAFADTLQYNFHPRSRVGGWRLHVGGNGLVDRRPGNERTEEVVVARIRERREVRCPLAEFDRLGELLRITRAVRQVGEVTDAQSG